MSAARIEIVKTIARKAGDILLKYYHTKYEVVNKEDNTPVTIADREANEFIVEELTKAFPDESVCSEEGVNIDARLQAQKLWFVDPIDGTNGYIAKTDDFSVMIGEVYQGKSVLGVIYSPVLGEMYWGIKGEGAYLETKSGTSRLAVRPRAVSDWASLTLVTRAMTETKQQDPLAQRLGILHEIPKGSFGLRAMLIARGRADVFIHTSHHACEWDSCAADIILHEAGGTLTDLSGHRVEYNKNIDPHLRNGAIATGSQSIHNIAVERMRNLLVK